MSFTDETLMAFADGELPPKEASRVEAAAQNDPAIAARIQRHRAVRTMIAAAAAAASPEPRPGLLAEAKRRAGTLKTTPAARSAPVWSFALAAGLGGLVIGLGGATLWPSQVVLDVKAGLVARGALDRALDATASGQVFGARGLDVEPLYSLTVADGRPCRAFRIVSGAQASEGAACRENGAWRVIAIAPAAAPSSGYVAASGGEAPAVTAAIDALVPGETFSAAEEGAWITRRWRSR